MNKRIIELRNSLKAIMVSEAPVAENEMVCCTAKMRTTTHLFGLMSQLLEYTFHRKQEV